MIPNLRYDPDDPYPDSDGLPMAENTEQYQWIVKIKENLEILFADHADVFIAGDLLWYATPDRQQSGPMAPDVMVAFGRPKGRRGSYKQWEEDNVAPQVVFEILSPSNSREEMALKLRFYERFGAEEYYVYNPDNNTLEIYVRQHQRLTRISHLNGWVSPRLQIRFEVTADTLKLYHPDGQPFLSSIELAERLKQEQKQAAQALEQTAQVQQELATERQQAEKMRAYLRSLGIDPHSI
jgi:Uma2 family endonuclease